MIEHQYRTFFEQSLDAIVVTDAEGGIVEANPAALQLFGITRGDTARYTTRDAFVNPADRQEIVHRLERDGVVRAYHVPMRRADGTSFDAVWSGTVWRDQAGRVVGTLGVVRDITELAEMRRALEQRDAQFRAIVEGTNDIISLLDADGVIRYVTPSIATLGVSPAEVVGRRFLEMIHPADRAAAEERFARVTATPGLEATHPPTRVLLADGAVRWVESRQQNMLHNPALRAVVAHTRDITDRVSAEAARARVEEQLLQAQKMEAVGQLAGGVAHDFNNVLAAILGTAELALLSVPPGSELRADLETIRDSASRAAGITRQLLAFSRKQVITPRLLDGNEAIRAFEPLMSRLMKPEVSIQLQLGGDCHFEMDPVQFEQALLNLASNANDAMPRGGSVTVSTRTEERSAYGATGDVPVGTWAVIEFRDTGVGMDGHTVKRIFEPFFTTKGEGEGTGLGLATVYGIVKQAGGHIEVESIPGNGSTFRLLLPAGEPANRPRGEQPPISAFAGREAILVVEDEPAVRTPVCLTLRRLGYTVIEAKDAADALMLLAEFNDRVHMVITDLVMPDVGGAELIEALRATRPYMKVLYISGYSREFARARGAAPDAPFMQKPFTMAELARCVRETLDRTDLTLTSVA